MLHKPTGGFRTEEYADSEQKSRYKCGTKFKTPSDIADILDNNVCTEAKKDAFDFYLAVYTMKELESLPITTQSCQNMTRAPRIRAGAISAE